MPYGDLTTDQLRKLAQQIQELGPAPVLKQESDQRVGNLDERESGLDRLERIFDVARKSPKPNYCPTNSALEVSEHIHILLDHRNSNRIDLTDNAQTATFIPQIDTNLYCLCQQNISQNPKPMIGCDMCENWFHFECVKIPHRQQVLLSKSNETKYFCDFCRSFKVLMAELIK